MAVGHGKVILLGEHAVVYGRPALAAALGRGCRAVAERSSTASLRIGAGEVSYVPCAEENGGSESSGRPSGQTVVFAERPADDPQEEMLRLAFCSILDRCPEPRPALAVQVQTEIPGGAGLGCSAAMGVAVAGAIDNALGISRDYPQLIETCMAWERVFHGNPSGIDPAIAASGGVLLFQRGQPEGQAEQPGTGGEKLETRASSFGQGFRRSVFPKDRFELVVADSGVRSSTKEMVEKVASYRAASSKRVEMVFDEIARLVQDGCIALDTGNLKLLGELMDQNQALLSGLGVSSPHLEQLCRAARQAGALGAKLTGAGGGGCIIALAPDRIAAHEILEKMRQLTGEAFVAEIGT